MEITIITKTSIKNGLKLKKQLWKWINDSEFEYDVDKIIGKY